MRRILTLTLLTGTFYFSSCDLYEDHHQPHEELTFFTQIGSIGLAGGETAAEISAYDPRTKKLFVINAVKDAIDVVNMEDPFDLVYESEISISAYGSGVNSVSVKNGLLAAAVQSNPKTAPGKVVVWNTSDLSEIAVVTVGALPDMVTFSDNGNLSLRLTRVNQAKIMLSIPTGRFLLSGFPALPYLHSTSLDLMERQIV